MKGWRRAINTTAVQRPQPHNTQNLGRCFRGFVLPILEYCSSVWCSAANTHLKLLDRVISGASFLTGGLLECDPAHRRSVVVLYMLYKIRCSPMQPVYGDLPDPHVSVHVTCSAVIACQYTCVPHRCRTVQYYRSFIPLSVSLWNDLDNSVFDGVGLVGFKSMANAFLLA